MTNSVPNNATKYIASCTVCGWQSVLLTFTGATAMTISHATTCPDASTEIHHEALAVKLPRLVTAEASRPGDCPDWCDAPIAKVEHETAPGGNVRHVGHVTMFPPSLEDDVRVLIGASHWEDRADWEGHKNHGHTYITLEVRDAQCGQGVTLEAGLTADEARFLAASLTRLADVISGRELWGDWDEVHAPVASMLEEPPSA